jgi:hypothetical protein
MDSAHFASHLELASMYHVVFAINLWTATGSVYFKMMAYQKKYGSFVLHSDSVHVS